MDSIKQLLTEALQEIEDDNGYEALRVIVAAIEVVADELETFMYPMRFVPDEDNVIELTLEDFNSQYN